MANQHGSWSASEKLLLAALVTIVFGPWLATLLLDGWREDTMAHAGDSVAPIAAVLSAFATVMAVQAIRYQRESSEDQQTNVERQIATMEDQVKVQHAALKEQRDAFDQQIDVMRGDQQLQHAAIDLQRQSVAAQAAAIAEDHRQQRLARIQETYADAVTKLRFMAVAVNSAIEVWDAASDRKRILRDSLDGHLLGTAAAQCFCEFIDHDEDRIATFRRAMEEYNGAYQELAKSLDVRPANLTTVDVNCDDVGKIIAASIRREIEKREA